MRWALALVVAVAAAGQSPEALRWADHWAEEFGIQRELVHAVIEVESAWDAAAVSSAGAAGLMQLMPATAAMFGVRNRFDVAENIRGGVAYLAWLRRVCGGDWRLVLASYNAGPSRVLRRGLRYGAADVSRYVERVAHVYRRNRWQAVLTVKGKERR